MSPWRATNPQIIPILMIFERNFSDWFSDVQHFFEKVDPIRLPRPNPCGKWSYIDPLVMRCSSTTCFFIWFFTKQSATFPQKTLFHFKPSEATLRSFLCFCWHVLGKYKLVLENTNLFWENYKLVFGNASLFLQGSIPCASSGQTHMWKMLL